jgi:hypothetical protein
MAAISHVFTLARVAQMLGEDEDWLNDNRRNDRPVTINPAFKYSFLISSNISIFLTFSVRNIVF